MKLAPFWAKSKKTKQLAALDAKRKALVFDPPPIWFWPKKKKENGEKSKIESENNFKEVELFLDPTNRALGKFKVKVRVLREPKPEEWLIWIRDIENIFESYDNLSPRSKALMIPNFLVDSAKGIWQKHYAEAVARVGTENPLDTEEADAKIKQKLQVENDLKIYERTLVNCTHEFLHKEQPGYSEKNYLRKHLSMSGYTVRTFVNRLKQINDYFPYFPPRYPGGPKVEKLDEDEIVGIIV